MEKIVTSTTIQHKQQSISDYLINIIIGNDYDEDGLLFASNDRWLKFNVWVPIHFLWLFSSSSSKFLIILFVFFFCIILAHDQPNTLWLLIVCCFFPINQSIIQPINRLIDWTLHLFESGNSIYFLLEWFDYPFLKL